MAATEPDITDPASIDRAAVQPTRDRPDLNVLLDNPGIMLPDETAARIDDKLLSTLSPPT